MFCSLRESIPPTVVLVRPPFWLMALALLLPLAGSGCRSAQLETANNGEPQYRNVHLVYEVNARYRDLPLQPPGVKYADHETQDPSSQQWKSAELQVDYPHPDGLPNVARATLRLSSQSDSVYTPVDSAVFRQGEEVPADLRSEIRPMCDDEIWVLDVPRQQLDQLLVDLNEAGFFRTQMPNEMGTRLDVRINGGRTAKTWTAEPRLDEFVHRVHADGRLSGFVTCGSELPHGPSLAHR